ncbi:MAG TPA: YheC/YheD family protein [Thermaerobacter sp.]
MVRLLVRVEIEAAGRAAPVRVAKGLLRALRCPPGRHIVRFGTRHVRIRLDEDDGLPPGRVLVPAPVAERLALPGGGRMAIQPGAAGLELGPLIGLMVAPSVLARLRAEGIGRPFAAYARHSRELGAVLCLFSPGDVEGDANAIKGYRPEERRGGRWHLTETRFPVPRVVLRRVFSDEGPDSDPLTARGPEVGCTVLRIGRLTHLEGLQLAATDGDLAPRIPWTRRLGPDTLAEALEAFPDLFVKPDVPSGGAGVYRLTRQERGWRLIRAAGGRNGTQDLPDPRAVQDALAAVAGDPTAFVVQEALPLATYLGNPFDVFALVQPDAGGHWGVSALLARIAAPGRALTSPGAGGWVAPGEAALRHAFPSRWRQLRDELERIARAAARAVDAGAGPRFELGVQLALLPDGAVRLLQVEGQPRLADTPPLCDAYAAQRLYRCPIHRAVGLALEWAQDPLSPAVPPA